MQSVFLCTDIVHTPPPESFSHISLHPAKPCANTVPESRFTFARFGFLSFSESHTGLSPLFPRRLSNKISGFQNDRNAIQTSFDGCLSRVSVAVVAAQTTSPIAALPTTPYATGPDPFGARPVHAGRMIRGQPNPRESERITKRGVSNCFPRNNVASGTARSSRTGQGNVTPERSVLFIVSRQVRAEIKAPPSSPFPPLVLAPSLLDGAR